MRPTAWIPAAALSVLLAGSCLRAAETPPAAPAGGGPVTLAFKFKTGQLQRFRAKVKSAATVTMEGSAGGGLGPIPIELAGHVDYSEKVMGTRAGTGTLAAAVEALNLSGNALGSPFELKLVNGKLVASRNGQAGGPGIGGVAGLLGDTQIKPITVHRAPTGQTDAATPGTESQLASLMGGQAGSPIRLPESPVNVGDSWESVQKVHASALGGAAGAATELDLRLTHTLKALEQKAGHQIAVIETIGTTAAPRTAAPPTAPDGGAAPPTVAPTVPPPAAATSPDSMQDITATTRFDVERGAVVSAELTIDTSTTANLPQAGGPGAGGAAAASGMRIDGNTKVSLAELTAASTAGRKPVSNGARKKPGGRR